MSKIPDLLFQIVFVYFKKFKEAGASVSSYLLSVPLTFNLILVINFAKELMAPKYSFRDNDYSPLIVFIMFTAPAFIFNRLLDKRYIETKKWTTLNFDFPLIIYFVFGALYFFGSIIIGLASFKYL